MVSLLARWITTALLMLATAAGVAIAQPGTCGDSVAADGNFVNVGVICGHTQGDTSPASPEAYYTAYRWVPFCVTLDDPTAGPVPCDKALLFCESPWRLMKLLGLHDGQWKEIGWRCRPPSGPTEADTLAAVTSAFRRIPLPHLPALTEPAATTLVNLETIFHTTARPFTRDLTLLGQQITLRITPASYHWTYGDGTTETTTTPGDPYPAHTITHRYQHHGQVTPHLAITWTAQWHTPGQPWQPVPETITTTGPTTALLVKEAVPALTGGIHK